MQPPAQELIAKDLHDISWKFRHIYRGTDNCQALKYYMQMYLLLCMNTNCYEATVQCHNFYEPVVYIWSFAAIGVFFLMTLFN